MRHEGLYLLDIVEAADYIATFIAGSDSRTFEAAARISDDLKMRHPDIA